MPKLKPLLLALFLFVVSAAKATTWDEPWHKAVVKQADYFVLAKVIACDPEKVVTIRIIRQLGGGSLSDTIKISNFYLLSLCSSSAGEGPEFHFKNIDSCYFFIKANEKKEYCIATPTTGFAVLSEGNVAATYRHSYHQAWVGQQVYENTMTAIFKNYHNQPYDKAYITSFISKYLGQKPAGYNQEEAPAFFKQHVAMECIYHLNLSGYSAQLLPFLRDTSNMHNQISAARALASTDDLPNTEALLMIIGDKASKDFLKVIAIWTLGDYKPKKIKARLITLSKTASTKENSFGGNIMDPRVCTGMPTVKAALTKLITKSI